MKVSFNRAFLKELSDIPPTTRLKIEELVFKTVPNYSSINEIASLKKLKGYRNYYRIRLGDYKIGIKIDNEVLNFERVLHRKEIYKRFP